MDDPSIFDLHYVLSSCATMSPDEEEELRAARPTLNLLNVKYEVSEKVGPWWKGACFRRSKSKTVLRDFTAQFRGGEIVAILGSSGSGKTSLLDVIACRTSGKVSGKVYYNNYECTKEVIKQYGAYVMQADRLFPNLTVRETLQYAAFLRLPGRTTSQEIESKVNKVIQEMGLKNVAESKIGGTVNRGISGGERRRVTIAIQLLQDPKILMLDEPTTGLDSYTARYLVSNLADIAHNSGKLVILTIHQPRSELFKLFDMVCIMSMGEQVFLGKSSELVDYFGQIGHPCPTFANPLDHYIDLASVDRRNHESEFDSATRVKALVQTFSMSEIHNETLNMVMEETMKPSTRRTLVLFYKPRPPNIFRIINALVGRMMVNLGRDRTIYISRLFLLSLFVPFICAFLGHMKTNQESIQDRVGLMYQSLSVPPYVAILNGVALFPPMRDMYYRETRDGLYGTVAFMIAYVLHIVPFTLFASFIFSIIVYWVTGLYPEWQRFGIYYAVVFVLHLVGEIMTVGCMGVFQNAQIANSTITLILTASLLFSSGLLRSLESMIEIFHWAAWFTIHKYSTEVLVANEFHGSNFTCATGPGAAPCQFRTGDEYLEAFYPDAIDNFYRNFGAIAGFILSFLTVTIIAFKIRGIPNLN
ncbi:ATP-binding cassette sub-family G member 5-like [Mizuhopecten yessoensis]|uniref:ATP-binding cassette sub-family G member 5 n=1 Tax=Mizuhopecten yessoensis TaxID=6573 RepID=A0A210Q7Z0_MIZYE|nr:ATP-binding cassette sub-family G member 5-like [Mizuhopecten yessoensis]XP_021364831.1 ATP-binding cassette sub-family G member 5-like [Mizuhopecten yessoensis]XP_021364833.1 ATP-binding cassette sub-family G member 5-like [Mizuhopecten yessoensis]OWF44862.1 ATP-binding cassette sub-family G member 5 [Mizuhopecten yessoensis]